MKPENPKPLGHDVVLEYIPLLVNGSLDKDTKASVEAHIHSCKECQLELSFERSVQSATKPGKDVSSLAMSNLKKVNEKIDALTDTAADSKSSDTLKDRVGGFFQSLFPPSPVLGGAMAMGVCAIFAVSFLHQPAIDDYPVGTTRGIERPSVIDGKPVGTTSGEQQDCDAGSVDNVQNFEYQIAHSASTADISSRIESVIEGIVPDTHYILDSDGQSQLKVTLDVTTCDSVNHELKRQFEESIEGVDSVKMRNLSLSDRSDTQ